MIEVGEIRTVGLCPCWDIVCRADGIEWGDHKIAESVRSQPAGKALNISRALAWTGQRSMAAGLWGRDDFEQMRRELSGPGQLIKIAFTQADGHTRRNVTFIDTSGGREMHLRSISNLATVGSLRRLGARLRAVVRRGDVCVFAGAMPAGDLARAAASLVKICKDKGAAIAVDTSGEVFAKLVESKMLWLIKPNVSELCELLGRDVPDRVGSLVKAGRELLDKIRVVLISRGSNGAVLVTRGGAWSGKCAGRAKVLSTVGCGDYLLAGFIKGLKDGTDYEAALETGLKMGTAKARGLTGRMSWPEAQRKLSCAVRKVQ